MAAEHHNRKIPRTVARPLENITKIAAKNLDGYLFTAYPLSRTVVPTNPGCRLDLYDALNDDRAKGVPFKETKIYKDWDNYYKVNLTPIY